VLAVVYQLLGMDVSYLPPRQPLARSVVADKLVEVVAGPVAAQEEARSCCQITFALLDSAALYSCLN